MQGSGMMASLNLKTDERERLYYNKYSYKAVIKIIGAYYTNGVKNIDEYKNKVDTVRSNTRWPIYTLPNGLKDSDYLDIEKLINFTLHFEKNDKGTIRRENNTVSFFSNDLDLLKTAPSTVTPLKIYEAKLLPAGVKYFKRTVPAPYRVHLKETRVKTEIKQDIIDYINKTEGVEPSDSLYRWLHKSSIWNEIWCSNTYFINYTDDSQLMMMHILFSEVIGKNYKLEKK
jgi:hypothetical protein